MATSACYEDAVAFATVRASRPRSDPSALLAWTGGGRVDAAAELLPPLVHYADHGVGESPDGAIRLLDEVRRVAVVEAAAGRRIPPRTCHQLVDTSLRIASGVAARQSESSELRGSRMPMRMLLQAFFENPRLTHGVIEAIAAIGQMYQDFGPELL